MNTNIIQINGDLPITVACKKIIDNQIGSLLVDNDAVLTKSDIISTIAKLADPGIAKIRDFSSKPLITCLEHDRLEDAMLKMAKLKIKRIFIVNERNDIVGIITSTDILRIAPGLIEVMREEIFLQTVEAQLEQKEYFSGSCDNCKNHREYLKNVGGFALCKNCFEEHSDIDDAYPIPDD